ncbi:MAG: HlyD family efflux transporter periplasmic adaptor subunit [Planctomycetota bacterium]
MSDSRPSSEIDVRQSGQVRTPAWRDIVQELSRAAERPGAFEPALLSAMARVAGAKQAAWFALDAAGAPSSDPESDEVRARLVWPEAPGGAGADDRLEEPDVVRAGIRRVRSTAQTCSMTLGVKPGLYEASKTPHDGSVLCVPVGHGAEGAPMSAVSLLIDARSTQALKTTIALAELLAGYANLSTVTQQLVRTRSAAASLDLAARLIATVNAAKGFKGAAMQMVNDLCRHLKADRVALGWRRGRAGSVAGSGGDGSEGAIAFDERDTVPVRVVALSDTEHVDVRMAMVRKLAAAMDECIDQSQPVAYPVPSVNAGGAEAVADPVLARAVTHAHRELAASDANLKVASLPVRDGDAVLGVVTIESAAPGRSIEPVVLERLQATLDLVGPVLRVRHSDDRPVPVRTGDALRRLAAWLVGPRHTLWKVAGAAVVALTLAAVFVRLPYRIEAPVTLQPVERRIIATPFEATLVDVSPGAEPGRRVAAGTLLASLDTSELELSAVEARGQVAQAEAQAREAMRRGDGAEQQQAEARAEQSRARLALFERRIRDAAIVAPISGTILTGDLRQQLGAKLNRGDPLFEIAPLEAMRVVAEVDDRDIGLILDATEANADEGGVIGSVATRAYPDRRFPLVVERVVPMARAEGGQNAFEVHARLEGSAAWMRPGMEGLAKLDVGDRPVGWIATRRIVDTLRLWLWW